MLQRFEPASTSATTACMWSPGATVMFVIVIEGAGTSSHQAEYDARPAASTSCSVPVWISVPSPIVQPASTQPPPMPIQSDENSAWPGECCVAAGTVQSPLIDVKTLPPCSSEPWTYPNQFVLWFALAERWRSWPWLDAPSAAGVVTRVRRRARKAAPQRREVVRMCVWYLPRRLVRAREHTERHGGRGWPVA